MGASDLQTEKKGRRTKCSFSQGEAGKEEDVSLVFFVRNDRKKQEE